MNKNVFKAPLQILQQLQFNIILRYKIAQGGELRVTLSMVSHLHPFLLHLQSQDYVLHKS